MWIGNQVSAGALPPGIPTNPYRSPLFLLLPENERQPVREERLPSESAKKPARSYVNQPFSFSFSFSFWLRSTRLKNNVRLHGTWKKTQREAFEFGVKSFVGIAGVQVHITVVENNLSGILRKQEIFVFSKQAASKTPLKCLTQCVLLVFGGSS